MKFLKAVACYRKTDHNRNPPPTQKKILQELNNKLTEYRTDWTRYQERSEGSRFVEISDVYAPKDWRSEVTDQ